MKSQVSWQDKWKCIFEKIRIVHNQLENERLLLELCNVASPLIVGFVNAHAMNKMVLDDAFYEELMKADILLRDGKGIEILYRRRGILPGINMNGTDFIPGILAAHKDRRVALWGTEEPYLGLAAKNIRQKYGVQLVSCQHGFEETSHYLTLAQKLQPDLILLGMGMPKQEKVASQIRAAAGSPVLIVCGGAIIDFLGNRVTRAPFWMRRLGLEWLYRLVLEPKRLFGRYVFGNPLFLFRLIIWR